MKRSLLGVLLVLAAAHAHAQCDTTTTTTTASTTTTTNPSPCHPAFGPLVVVNADATSDGTIADRNPAIATNGSGLWLAAWQSNKLPHATRPAELDLFLSRSTDGGASWTAAVPLNGDAATDIRADEDVRLVTDGAGTWVAVWRGNDRMNPDLCEPPPAECEPPFGSDTDIWMTRSTDDGAHWSAPAPLNPNAATDDGFEDEWPELATDGAGNWVAVWETRGVNPPTDTDIAVARSSDNGATWSGPIALNSNAAFDWQPHVAADGLGHWVAVWTSKDDLGGTIGSDHDILVARSSDNGATWTVPAALNGNAATDDPSASQLSDVEPEVASDGIGHWVTVWNAVGGTGVARSTDNGLTWTAPTIVTGDQRPRLVTDRAGTWLLVWDQASGVLQNVYLSRSTDEGATWTPAATLNSNAGTGLNFWPRVAVGTSGDWVAVWGSTDPRGGPAGQDYDVFAAPGACAP